MPHIQSDVQPSTNFSPPGAATLLLFFFGDRESILKLARSRHTLWVGAIFVLAAGLAREYDQEDLLRSPWYLLIPFAASAALSFLLLLVVRRWRNDPRPFFAEYRAFLSLFWMTAPLALLYGIPYERLLDPANAVSANLWTLAFVALWRVLLMSRVAGVFTGQSMRRCFYLIMPVAEGVVTIGLMYMPVPLIQFMGGVQLSDAERRLSSLHQLATFVSVASLILWVPIGLVALMKLALGPQPALVLEKSAPPRGLFALAIAAVLIWTPFFPAMQKQQRLRTDVDRKMLSGDIAGAIAEMSEHQPKDFPPNWSPPPRIGWADESPDIVRVMEVLTTQPAAPWVRAIFIDKFERGRFGMGRIFHHVSSEELDSLLDRLPEGPALRVKHDEIGDFQRMQTPATEPALR